MLKLKQEAVYRDKTYPAGTKYELAGTGEIKKFLAPLPEASKSLIRSILLERGTNLVVIEGTVRILNERVPEPVKKGARAKAKH